MDICVSPLSNNGLTQQRWIDCWHEPIGNTPNLLTRTLLLYLSCNSQAICRSYIEPKGSDHMIPSSSRRRCSWRSKSAMMPMAVLPSAKWGAPHSG